RIDEAPHRVHDAGQRLGERRVDGPAGLGRGAREVHVDPPAAQCHSDLDLARTIRIDAVTVDLERTVIRALRQASEVVTDASFRLVDRVVHETLYLADAEAIDELGDSPG